MDNKGLVSIVVPVYNVDRYLPECIDSILSQVYPTLEIILVDDGSTDGCASICDAYAKQDSRIQVIHQPNGGLSNARNTGIAHCSGDYLLFVDSDDLISPYLVERLICVLESTGADLAICDPLHMETAPSSLDGVLDTDFCLMTPHEAIREMWYQTSFLPSAWGKLFRRDLFDEIRFREGICYEDIDIMHLLFERASSIAYTPSKLYFYRHRSGSITQEQYSERDCEQLNIARSLQEYAKGDRQLKKAANAYAVTCAFRVLLNAPRGMGLESYLKTSRRILRRHYLSVLTDRHVRRKTRLALLLYLMPLPVVRAIYRRVDRWKG